MKGERKDHCVVMQEIKIETIVAELLFQKVQSWIMLFLHHK